MFTSALPSSESSSFAAISYERNLQIDATLRTTSSGSTFSASVEISISLEARAVLQTEAISKDLKSLIQNQDETEFEDDEATEALLGAVEQGVLEVLSLVASKQITAEAGTKILDASETFRGAVQELLDDVNKRSLDREHLDRLNEAEDEFHTVADSVLGSPLSDTQEALLELADKLARKTYKAAQRILAGHDPSIEQARLFNQAEQAFSHALEEIFSENRDITEDDEHQVKAAVTQLQISIDTSISAQFAAV